MIRANIYYKIAFVIFICLLFTIGTLFSYAFFTYPINSNDKLITNKTGTLSLTFKDGNSGINKTLNFGESITKTFEIINDGSLDAIAKISWDKIINTYIYGSLTFTLEYSEKELGEYTKILENIEVPRSLKESTIQLADGLEIPSNTTYYYKLTITLNYLKDVIQNDDLNAKLSTRFTLSEGEKSPSSYDVEISNGTYSIASSREKIPVIINNNNEYEIKGKVVCNHVILLDNFKIPANVKEYMLHVPVTEELLNSMNPQEEYHLDINIIAPHISHHKKEISLKKEIKPISIINVSPSNENVSFTQNTLNIDIKPKEKITYTVTVKNNTFDYMYKFRNISNIYNPADTNYKTDISLSDGIYIESGNEYSFNITYDPAQKNEYKQILLFEFKRQIETGLVKDGLITLSQVGNTDELLFGDFSILNENFTSQTMHCTYTVCYSDNDGKFVYDTNSGLKLGEKNTIGVLNIDQSMGIDDNYSIYLTLKAPTNQKGEPDSVGTQKFPGTIIAVSENSTLYLLWLGFMKNYINIYSYYVGSAKSNINYETTSIGFTSFNIEEYDNELMNIIITATRSGKTNVYINGELKKEFDSGTSKISYQSATLGDLRPGRALKFNGVIYDLAVYNKALNEEEIMINWNNANSIWNIR